MRHGRAGLWLATAALLGGLPAAAPAGPLGATLATGSFHGSTLRAGRAVTTVAWDQSVRATAPLVLGAQAAMAPVRPAGRTPAGLGVVDSTLTMTLAPSTQPVAAFAEAVPGRDLYPVTALRRGRIWASRGGTGSQPAPPVALEAGDEFQPASVASMFDVHPSTGPAAGRPGRLRVSVSDVATRTLAYRTGHGSRSVRAYAVSGVIAAEGGDVEAAGPRTHPRSEVVSIPLPARPADGAFWYGVAVSAGADAVPSFTVDRGVLRIGAGVLFEGELMTPPTVVAGRRAGVTAFHLLVAAGPLDPVGAAILTSAGGTGAPARLVTAGRDDRLRVGALPAPGASFDSTGPVDALYPYGSVECAYGVVAGSNPPPGAAVDRAYRGGHLALRRFVADDRPLTGIDALGVAGIDVDGTSHPLPARLAESVVTLPRSQVFRGSYGAADGVVGPTGDLGTGCGAGSLPDGQVTSRHHSPGVTGGLLTRAVWRAGPVLLEATLGTTRRGNGTSHRRGFLTLRAISLDGEAHAIRLRGFLTLADGAPAAGPVTTAPQDFAAPCDAAEIGLRTSSGDSVLVATSGRLAPYDVEPVGDYAGPQTTLVALRPGGVVPAEPLPRGDAIGRPGTDLHLLSAPTAETPLPSLAATLTVDLVLAPGL